MTGVAPRYRMPPNALARHAASTKSEHVLLCCRPQPPAVPRGRIYRVSFFPANPVPWHRCRNMLLLPRFIYFSFPTRILLYICYALTLHPSLLPHRFLDRQERVAQVLWCSAGVQKSPYYILSGHLFATDQGSRVYLRAPRSLCLTRGSR